MTQCQGHDTKKKADTKCLNCNKPLCNSCLEIHLSIFDDCKLKSMDGLTDQTEGSA